MRLVLPVFIVALALLFLLDYLGVIRQVVKPAWRLYSIFQSAVFITALFCLEQFLGATPPALVYGGFIVAEVIFMLWAGLLAREQDKQKAQ